MSWAELTARLLWPFLETNKRIFQLNSDCNGISFCLKKNDMIRYIWWEGWPWMSYGLGKSRRWCVKNKGAEKQFCLASIWHWSVIGEHEFPLVRLSKLSICIKKRKKIPKFKLLPDFVIPDLAPGSTSHHSCCTMLAGVSKNASLAMSVAVKITLRSHGCPQFHSSWGACALAAEQRGREGTHI